MAINDKNLSTEHQPKGSAKNQSDTLDRENEAVAPGQRAWADDSAKKPDEAKPD
jgi:FtsZ-binding cell division protein ZapB